MGQTIYYKKREHELTYISLVQLRKSQAKLSLVSLYITRDITALAEQCILELVRAINIQLSLILAHLHCPPFFLFFSLDLLNLNFSSFIFSVNFPFIISSHLDIYTTIFL